MSLLLDLFGYIYEYSQSISISLVIISIVLAFYILIAEYKSTLLAVLLHKRNKSKFAFAFLLIALIILGVRFDWITNYSLVFLSLFVSIFLLFVTLSCKSYHFSGFQIPVLKRHEGFLLEGIYLEHLDYFDKAKPWYLITISGKVQYYMLACLYYISSNEYELALEQLQNIESNWLYSEEKQLYDLQKAYVLCSMGNMKAAYEILGEPQDNKSQEPLTWFIYSYIYENKGDIDTAFKYAEKSLNILESAEKRSNKLSAQVYNNYSRVALFRGNSREALYNLNIAWNLAKDTKDMRIVHIVASNRIREMSLLGLSNDECLSALEEYKSIIPNDSYSNLIEFFNCEIYYYRQIQDRSKVYTLIKNNFESIINRLEGSKRESFIASTFVMLANGRYVYHWLDDYINTSFIEDPSLSLIDKLCLSQLYLGIAEQIEYRVIFNQNPYKSLLQSIKKYLVNDALIEIDQALNSMNRQNMYRFMELSTYKLGILKLIEGKRHVDNSSNIYIQLYNTLYNAGLHLDAVKKLLLLLDECTSPYNVLIKSLSWHQPQYYCDYIDAAPTAPEPTVLEDGISLNYFQFNYPSQLGIIPLHDDIIKTNIDVLADEVLKWKNHPAIYDLCIEIAHLYMCIDCKSEAKVFYELFKSAGLSELQMASWVQNDIVSLENELQMAGLL